VEEKVVREQKEEQPAANTKQQMRFALRFVWAGLVFVMFLPSHPNLSHPISCSPSLKPSTIRQGNRLWWFGRGWKERKGQGTGRRKRATAVPSCSLRPFPDIFLTLSRLVPRFSLFISHVISKHPQHNFYMTNKKAKRNSVTEGKRPRRRTKTKNKNILFICLLFSSLLLARFSSLFVFNYKIQIIKRRTKRREQARQESYFLIYFL